LVAAARHVQRELLPLLDESPAFQRAVAEVVACQRHLLVVASGELDKTELGAAPDPAT
jgi:hypothetical protein